MTKLTPEQLKLIDCLLSGKTIVETAKLLKKSRVFVYDQLKLPIVQAEYNQRLNDLKTDSESRISGLYQKAIDTLEESLMAENESVRLKTALYLLERLDKMKTLETNPETIEAETAFYNTLKIG